MEQPDRRRALTLPVPVAVSRRTAVPDRAGKTCPVALACAGGISQSWLAKLPRVIDRLGPVKATNLAASRRIVNTLRNGWPVEDVRAFQEATFVFVAAPADLLEPTLDDLASAELNWTGKTLVILDTDLDCQDFGVFTLRNANVATLNQLEGFSDIHLVAQCDTRTAKRLRKLIEDGHTRMLELEPGAKGLYQAALTFATSIATPLIAACVESLEKAGFEPAQAAMIAEHSLSRTRRGFAKAGRKGWQGPLPDKDMQAIRRQWESLRRTDTLLADYFLESATNALEYFRQDSRCVSELSELPRRNGRMAPLLATASGD